MKLNVQYKNRASFIRKALLQNETESTVNLYIMIKYKSRNKKTLGEIIVEK
jgi:hypothetical protein